MGFWATLYFCLALPTLILGLLSRRRKLAVAGAIVFLSWVMTNTVLFSEGSDRTYLAYFVFDMVSAEILAFMLFHRFSWWNLAFLLATMCQLLAHLAFWQFGPPPRRYHEIINGFYWVQMAAVCVASRIRERRVFPSDHWLAPRAVFQREPSVARQYRPRTVPGQPRECPLQLRMWA